MIEAMVRYGEYLTRKNGLDLDKFDGLVKDALIENDPEKLNELMKFFEFAVDRDFTLIYLYDRKKRDYAIADETFLFRIFPVAPLSGKIKNAIVANHPVINSKNIRKYHGILIKRGELERIQDKILKKKFNKKIRFLSDQEKENLRTLVCEELRKLLGKSGITLKNEDVFAIVDKFNTNKNLKRVVLIPKEIAENIDVRKYLIEAFLFGKESSPTISSNVYHCPLCGKPHHWENIKVFFPVNIQSEKTLNFLSNLSLKGRQKVCATCAYNLLRLTDPNTQFNIKSKYHGTILAYPYGYTDEGMEFSEQVLITLKDMNEGLFALPEVVLSLTRRNGTKESSHSSELWLYIITKTQTRESVVASYHITDFDKLAQLGKYQYQINQFRRLVGIYMQLLQNKRREKHKLVTARILASMYTNFDINSINLPFIKLIIKTIIQKGNARELYGKYFLPSYLHVCGGDNLPENRNVDMYWSIYNFGVVIGELWRILANEDKGRFNSYRAKLMKLDTSSINVLSDTVRYMIQKLAESEILSERFNEKIKYISSKYKSFPMIITDNRARELFITGAYFGFFSSIKEERPFKN